MLGVPVYRQRFRTPASAKAVERFDRLARACCAWVEHLREPFEGVVECDKTTCGGHGKGKRGWGAAGKVIAFGILQRNGLVKLFPVEARRGGRIIRRVCAYTRPGSRYDTDTWQAYASLAVRGAHIVVRKDGGRPKGRDHLNGIEGFRGSAKHWLSPYRGCPRNAFTFTLGKFAIVSTIGRRTLYPFSYGL